MCLVSRRGPRRRSGLKVPNKDGSCRPLPQGSSGHPWHHGEDLLAEITLEGFVSPKSRMPRFEGRLSEEDVLFGGAEEWSNGPARESETRCHRIVSSA